MPVMRLVALVTLSIGVALLSMAPLPAKAGLLLVVNSAADTSDTNPGDGICGIPPGPEPTPTPGPGPFVTQAESTGCTLRAAIEEVNATPGADTINFNIASCIDFQSGQTCDPGTPVRTIIPGSPLPGIYPDPVTIDGTTQPGFAGSPIIELNGQNAGPDAFGLAVAAKDTIIRGLVINRFGGDGILFSLSPGGGLVQGNFIGTNVEGTAALGNDIGVALNYSDDAKIGGVSSAWRNLISGNRNGIVLSGGTNNFIIGNYIGTDVTGNAAVANTGGGIAISGNGTNTIGDPSPGAGNVISGNHEEGVVLFAGTGVVKGNRIGTNAAGTEALPNEKNGILVVLSGRSTIGGVNPGDGNLISGNAGGAGIFIGSDAATGTTILGNYVGTDASGTAAMPNNWGVLVEGSNSTVGGTVPGAGNVISGNNSEGVAIFQSANVFVQGNFIGTDSGGNKPLGNGDNGVSILGPDFGSPMNNVIGGETEGARNIISGNRNSGISIDESPGNVVQGNYIGTDVTGMAPVGNSVGVFIQRARDTLIGGENAGAGNLISGNQASGLTLFAGSNNKVQGNFIGTNNDGTAALGNGDSGVLIFDTEGSDSGTLIGGSSPAARNLISANRFGVNLSQAGGIAIQGNYIGTDVTGDSPLGNTASGVLIENAKDNLIGGEIAGMGNLISGNAGDGVITLGSSYENKVQGNYIGTNSAGTAGVGKQRVGIEIGDGGSSFAGSNLVGGRTPEARNLISGNEIGVFTYGSGGNAIEGNYIGTDASGSRELHNLTGVLLGSAGNTVGGTAPGTRNLISGNGGDGVAIEQFIGEASSNVVQGNYIGTDASGNSSVPNGRAIEVGGASNNLVGGSAAEARNVISGNGSGITLFQSNENSIKGNYIGVDASGEVRLDNSFEGISVDQSSQNNTIGGTDAADRNVISANQWGVWIRGFSSRNLIAGNYIGTNASGTAVIGNRTGIIIGEFAENNTIGGVEPGAGNVISGSFDGVDIIEGANANILRGNYIGTDPSGTADWGNEVGVSIDQSDNNIIGGVVPGSGNTIAHNRGNGVDVFGLASIGISVGNTIRGNSIYSNGGKGISNTPQQNEELPPPLINSAGSAAGTACADCTIDVYSDDEDEGRIYHGSTVADASGNWRFSGAVVGPHVTVTATDADGTTSEFSAPFACLDEDGDGVCNSGDPTPLGECAGMAVTILGSDGPDSLVGTPAADVINGAGGDDFIQGGDGDDVICGGSGDDLMDAQDGRDAIYGEAGNDRLKGDKGADLLDGGDGSDRCYGGEGRDVALNCEKRSSIP